jgi:hypothetical protein
MPAPAPLDDGVGAAKRHYAAVEAFCGDEGRCDEPLWAGLRAWAAGRRAALEGKGGDGGGGAGAAAAADASGGGEAGGGGSKRARTDGGGGGGAPRWELPAA